MGAFERSEQKGPQKRQQRDEAVEVVAGGGKDEVDSVAGRMGKTIPAHAILCFHVADDRFNCRLTLKLAFGAFGDAALLARCSGGALCRSSASATSFEEAR